MRARRQSHDSFDAAECWAKSPSIQTLSNDFEKRGFVLNPMLVAGPKELGVQTTTDTGLRRRRDADLDSPEWNQPDDLLLARSKRRPLV